MEIVACPPRRFAEVLEFWRHAGAEPTTTDDVAALETLHAHDPGALRLALVDGEIAGTLVSTFDGWRGSLSRMAVAREHRRNGIATALLADGEERLTGLGVRRIAIVVVHGHEDAVAFWSKVGYAHMKLNLRYVKDLPGSS